jgi:hypothetical protein
MIKFLKTTKFWMYLPYACFFMSKWALTENDKTEKYNRFNFLIYNLMFTVIVNTLLVVFIYLNV